MSDPVSNSEIEDVLASIRRLVSENAKALKGDRGHDPAAEKLVLTPALRIDESEAPSESADVFAVETDTWNDVSDKTEDTDTKGIFSHREQKPPVAAARLGSAGADMAGDTEEATPPENAQDAQAAQTATDDGLRRAAEAVTGTADAVTGAGAEEPAGAESEPAASAAATALEQRIAELETVMDLRPADDEALSADAAGGGASGDGQGEPASPATLPEAEDTAETAASGGTPETSREQVAKAPDAPPRSWIEGLVAAAAAAEAGRLAARVSASEDAQGADGATGTAIEEPATGEDGSAAGELDTGDQDTGDQDTGVAETGARDIMAAPDESVSDAADQAASSAPFELTEAHAAPPEAETIAPVAAGGPIEPVPEGAASESDLAEAQSFGEAGEAADEDRGVERAELIEEVEETTVEVAEVRVSDARETGPDAGSQEGRTSEPGEAGAAPERSWVDRLIAAAATLRDTPAAGTEDHNAGDRAEEGEGETAAGDDGVGAQVEETSYDAAEAVTGAESGAVTGADEPDTGDLAGGAEAEEAPAALEPLSLVDPIATEAQTEAVMPDWEPVAPPEQAGNASDEPLLDADTVLAGPWTAGAAETARADTPGAEAEAETDRLAAPEGKAGDDATDRAVEDVPVSALEWEPVEPPTEPVSAAGAEADHAAEPDANDREVAASGDRGESLDDLAPIGAADEGDDSDFALEGVDGQGEDEEEIDDLEAVRMADDDAMADDAMADAEDAAEGPQGPGDEDLSKGVQADSVETDGDGASDEDTAAVAAAAEADVDWGEAGMAAAGVAAMTVARDDPEARADDHANTHDRDEDEATDGARGLREARGEDEMVIDEGMLRELVAQLVREELQGTVGERITHNVRRLIRREIARALTLQDFER